jgi:hypothetical protein
MSALALIAPSVALDEMVFPGADLGDRPALAAHDVGLAQLVNNLRGRKPRFRHDPLNLRSSIARNIRLDQEFQVRPPLDRHNAQSVMGTMSHAIVHAP